MSRRGKVEALTVAFLTEDIQFQCNELEMDSGTWYICSLSEKLNIRLMDRVRQ